MSAICSLAIFSINGEKSKSKDVAKIIRFLQEQKINYKLTSMSTIIEAQNLDELLQIISKCYKLFDENERVYISANFDIDNEKNDAITYKVNSVKEKLK